MPYIQVNTTQTLDQAKREAVKSGLGQLITLLPNKTEALLMVDLSEGHTMYFAGEQKENCAYVDVKIYGSAGFAAKAEFTKGVFQLLEQTLGLKESEIYVSIGEFSTWGTKGALK